VIGFLVSGLQWKIMVKISTGHAWQYSLEIIPFLDYAWFFMSLEIAWHSAYLMGKILIL
jgi:hypothetical protein